MENIPRTLGCEIIKNIGATKHLTAGLATVQNISAIHLSPLTKEK